MECKICGSFFYIKRRLLDLFSTSKVFICDRCYKTYPISLKMNRVYLDEYECIIISMFDKYNKINYDAFVKEYQKIFLTYYNKKEYETLFFDRLILNDEKIENLYLLCNLFDKNLIVLVFNLKVEDLSN